MTRKKSEAKSHFLYERGNFKFIGQTEKDRRSVRIDNILYWTYRIILATAILLGAIGALLK